MSDTGDHAPYVLATLVAGAAFKYGALAWLRSRREVYERVGKVSQILLYPLKSTRELGVKQADVTRHGLKHGHVLDRHWLVTHNGRYYTILNNSRMATVKVHLEDGYLCIDAVGMETLYLPDNPVVDADQLSSVRMKFDTVPALDCGDKAAAWISQAVGKAGLRIHFSAPSLPKRQSLTVKKDWATNAKPGDEVVFQEFANCMMMCESSLETLNRKLEKPVSCVNFRPNIMVEGTTAFDEDNWKAIRIGEATFRFVDKCQRCLMTTVDPQTGKKDPGEQPLKTLKTYKILYHHGRDLES